MIEDPNNFGILTTDDEKTVRLNLCNSCTMRRIDNIFGDICDACACPIDYVTTYKFKICPLNKWEI